MPFRKQLAQRILPWSTITMTYTETLFELETLKRYELRICELNKTTRKSLSLTEALIWAKEFHNGSIQSKKKWTQFDEEGWD